MSIEKVLENLELKSDGIYDSYFQNSLQNDEVKLRKYVSGMEYSNYLERLSHNHSIEVMDYEICLFLKEVPQNGIIIDMGGCWGWHWRKICTQRPDIKVVILDFVRENLNHALNILASMINKQVFLVHGDGTQLPFDDHLFDAYWAAGSIQSIPNYIEALKESHRVLKTSGYFSSYWFNLSKKAQIMAILREEEYMVEGHIPGKFYLTRASKKQRKIIAEIFDAPVKQRYSEILFDPEGRLRKFAPLFGGEGSIIGKIDARLSNNFGFLSWFAQQRSFHVRKN